MNLQQELRAIRARIREADTACQEHETRIENALFGTLKNKYPLTFLSLYAFLPRLDSLRDAVLSSAGRRDLYACRVLVRSTIEHFARLVYLYLRLIDEETDEPGKEFAVIAKYREDMSLGTATLARQKLVREEANFDPYELLLQVYPSAAAYSKKEIVRIAEQFKFSNVVSYISEKCEVSEGEVLPYFPNALIAYSETSAYVHGGAAAVINTSIEMDRNRLTAEISRIAWLAYGEALSGRNLVFQLMSKYDRRLKPVSKVFARFADRMHS